MLKFYLALLLALLGWTGGSHAQSLVLKQDTARTGALTYIRLNTQAAPQALASSAAVLRQVLQLTPEDELRLQETHLDELGYTHQRYAQYYRGVRVEYGSYRAHGRQALETLNGEVLPVRNLSPTPTLPAAAALSRALATVGARQYLWQVPAEEQWLKQHRQDAAATYYPTGELLISALGQPRPRLAYKFVVYAAQPAGAWYLYVDAHTGQVFRQEPVTQHANAPGTAATRYSQTRPLTTDSFAGGFRLRETNRGSGLCGGGNAGAGIETYNLRQGSQVASAVDFVDNDNSWTEHDNAALDNVALDAHWGAEKTYDYFRTVHCRNSFDGNGATIKGYVHANLPVISPVFGSNDNAAWDRERRIVYYGDGATRFRPLTSLDVVAHELGHAYAQSMAGFSNQAEAPALNEGFSDIWGACVEYWAAPTKQTWKIGEDITRTFPCQRNLANPNTDIDPTSSVTGGYPDVYQGQYWDGGNNGHTNSTVLSHWFYLLSVGRTGTNSAGRAYSVAGIGIDKAAKIAFRAERYYLSPTSSYNDARQATINATEELYGVCSPEAAAVSNAWYAVGLGPALNLTPPITGPTVLCETPATFQVNAYNVSWTASPASLFSTATGSGSQFTVQAAPGAAGQGYITATMCNGQTTRLAVLVGPPVVEDFIVDNQACDRGVIYLAPVLRVPAGNYSYQWSVIGTGASIKVGATAPSATVAVGSRYNFRVGLLISNACGEDYSESMTFINGSCTMTPLAAYPNPASTELLIEIIEANDTSTPTTEFEATLYTPMGSPVRQGRSQQGRLRFDVRDLPEGMYYLRTLREGAVATRQVQLKR